MNEPTPAEQVNALQPDVLVKGGDWPVEQIVGSDVVRRRHGRVLSLPLLPGYSTTILIERILAGHRAPVVADRPEEARGALPVLVDAVRV